MHLDRFDGDTRVRLRALGRGVMACNLISSNGTADDMRPASFAACVGPLRYVGTKYE